MVRVTTPGDNFWAFTAHWGGWFYNTDINCPRCGCVFRLDNGDFEVAGPLIDADFGQHLHWDQLDANLNVILAGHVSWFPDAVQGSCPWCQYYPIIVIGPDFGLIHPAAPGSSPGAGTLQGYITAGANRVTFFLSSLHVLYALFLASDGTPYLLDDTAHTSRAMIHTGPSTYNYNVTFPQTTPGQTVSVATAQSLDPVMCSYLQGIGFTLV